AHGLTVQGGEKPASGNGHVELWTKKERCTKALQAHQQQKKRTCDMLQNADIFDRYEQGRLLTERHGGRNDRFRGTSPAVFDIGIPIMWNPGPLEETRARTQPLSGQPIRKPTP